MKLLWSSLSECCFQDPSKRGFSAPADLRGQGASGGVRAPAASGWAPLLLRLLCLRARSAAAQPCDGHIIMRSTHQPAGHLEVVGLDLDGLALTAVGGALWAGLLAKVLQVHRCIGVCYFLRVIMCTD